MVLKQNWFYLHTTALLKETDLQDYGMRLEKQLIEQIISGPPDDYQKLYSHLLRLSCAGQRMFLLSHTNTTKLILDSYSSVFLFKIRESLSAEVSAADGRSRISRNWFNNCSRRWFHFPNHHSAPPKPTSASFCGYVSRGMSGRARIQLQTPSFHQQPR